MKKPWCADHLTALKRGETVQFRPTGSSMKGKIESGQLVTVVPIDSPGYDRQHLTRDDIVLCRVGRNYYVHLIKTWDYGGSEGGGKRFLIGNNKGRINGWADEIFGVVTKVET